MRNLVTLSAVALILAVVGSFWLIDRSAATSFATVIQNVRRATSLICLLESQEEGSAGQIEQTWYVREDGYRAEARLGKTRLGVAIIDFEKNKVLALDDRSKTAAFDSVTDRQTRENTPNLLEAFRNLKPENAQRLEDETIDGRRLEVYRLEGFRFMGSFISEELAETRLWVDPQTQLPARLTVVSTATPGTSGPRLGIAKSLWQFRWNEPLDPALFKLEVPKGYTLQKELPPQVAAADPESPTMVPATPETNNTPPAKPVPARIDRVLTETDQAVIEGHIGGANKLVLQIGREEDKLRWASSRTAEGPFRSVLKASNRIKLEGGSFGEGFIFKSLGATTRIHLDKNAPLLSGHLKFRNQTEVITKDGVITFADIVKDDGTSLPVTIRIQQQPLPAAPEAQE